VWALLATTATVAHDFRAAFMYLVVATFVDATDGLLARTLKVKERLPHFDGARLDDIVDYLTYVFVPVLIVWQANLVPVVFPIGAAMLLSSAYGFSHAHSKVESDDHYFTGFPSYWNIVVVYLYLLGWPPLVNALLLVVLALLVFVPIRYIYPSRTRTLKMLTLVSGAAWALMFTWLIVRLPDTRGPWAWLSLVFPFYYFALSLWLQFRR
jgi:phosphatidylcholine synthase